LGDEGGQEAGELLFDLPAGLHDLFVVERLIEDAGGHVGDQREAEDFEAHVAGDDDLVDGGHADEVCAEGAEGADLGGGFKAGAEDGEVDAFGEVELLADGLFDGEVAETERVRGGHVEEALAGAGDHGEAGFVGAEGGVGAGEVDVVGDGDDGALGETGADAAGGVGDDEGFAAEKAEDAGGEGDLGEGVALVGVDAALHDGDGDVGDVAEDEFAGVALNGGLGEVRDVGVGDGCGGLDVRGEGSKARAEDDADGGSNRGAGANVGGCGLGFAVDIGHAASCGVLAWVRCPPTPALLAKLFIVNALRLYFECKVFKAKELFLKY